MSMQGSRRKERVNVLLRKQLSEVIAHEMKDPRLAPLTTILHVGVSKDLRYAKVFVSVMGTPEEQNAAIETLNAASGFLRRELSDRLTLRNVPFLNFVKDDSIEKGTDLLNKIEQVREMDSHMEASADG